MRVGNRGHHGVHDLRCRRDMLVLDRVDLDEEPPEDLSVPLGPGDKSR